MTAGAVFLAAPAFFAAVRFHPRRPDPVIQRDGGTDELFLCRAGLCLCFELASAGEIARPLALHCTMASATIVAAMTSAGQTSRGKIIGSIINKTRNAAL